MLIRSLLTVFFIITNIVFLILLFLDANWKWAAIIFILILEAPVGIYALTESESNKEENIPKKEN